MGNGKWQLKLKLAGNQTASIGLTFTILSLSLYIYSGDIFDVATN